MEPKGNGRTFKMAQVEVKRAPDGRPLARRTDGKPLTPVEREEAKQMIQAQEDGDLSAKDPAKHQTDEVARILAVWRDLGIKDLDRLRARAGLEPVGKHLAALRSWRLKSQMMETRRIDKIKETA